MTDVPESFSTWLMLPLSGPLLNGPEIAEAFATLILQRLYGDEEVAKQRPLSVTDQGEKWLVMGSHQEPGKLPTTGAWFIKVRKSDCWVEQTGHYMPMDIPDEVKEIIAQAKKP